MPKYWKLAEVLREQIASGELAPGAQLSSVAQMQAQYGISLSTVNQAVTVLENDGLIVRIQGRGNFVARQPVKQTLGTLGLLLHIGSLTGAYNTELLTGIRQAARQQKLELLWLNDEDVRDCRQADAFLMYCNSTVAHALNPPADVPIVLLFQHTSDFTCIAVDDFNGAKVAARHLLEQGHRRIAYILSSDSDTISCQRLAGYRAALEEAGIGMDDRWIHFLKPNGVRNYRLDGETAMLNWLEADWAELGCTAILAPNDEAAIGMIRALKAHNIIVPDDLSVVGFDGTEVSELSTPRLTTVTVPLQEIGAKAVELLANQVRTGVLSQPQIFMLPAELKISESTASLSSKVR